MAFIFKAIELFNSLVKPKISISGIENIPRNKSILFVSNHFTRFETLLIPHILHENFEYTVRSLADDLIFVGPLGDYLKSMGTISLSTPHRNEIIIGDLISGKNHWLIYPEGAMIKNKRYTKGKKFMLFKPNRIGPVHTGAAVLALQATLIKDRLKQAKKKDHKAYIKKIQKDYFMEHAPCTKGTAIVPITLSYYPIRQSDSALKKILLKFFDIEKPRYKEEIEIESHLLSHADINIHFSKPIDIENYIKGKKTIIKSLPLNQKFKNKLIVERLRHPLTHDFMEVIYKNISINLDHIYLKTLLSMSQRMLSKSYLLCLLYENARQVSAGNQFLTHKSIEVGHRLLNEKTSEDIYSLCLKQGALSIKDDSTLKIHKRKLLKKYAFHEVRLKNILYVLVNEVEPVKGLSEIFAKNAQKPEEKIRQNAFKHLVKEDVDIFEKDYKDFYSKKFSKKKSIGKPYVFIPKKKKLGLVLCHGYKSAPKEVELLAKYLFDRGICVYAPRLKGHGTAPQNIEAATHEDWQDAFNRGYNALKCIVDDIIVAGFSTGGLLALRHASQYQPKGVICINAALKLNDIRVNYISTINFWNELLRFRDPYVDDTPEYPDTNYARNYLKGVEELNMLMEKTQNSLKKITAPTLIIQAKKDPVVDPRSGKNIFSSIQSQTKKLIEPNLDHHVIIRGKGSEEIFENIYAFIEENYSLRELL